MNEWAKAVVLGLVEGLTEFVPVSSTGHLLVASALLRLEQSEHGTFEIFIQSGAVLALLAFYGGDLLRQARALPRDAGTRRFWLSIALAFLPAAVLGLLLRSWIKTVLFASPSVIAWALIGGGLAFLVVEWLPRRPAEPRGLHSISPAQALVVGIAQALALVPGVSRSGASILGGMLAGLDRTSATTFSFYLAIPTLGAATLLDLLSSLPGLTAGDIQLFLVGTVVAAVVAGATIRWLLGYVAHHTFVPFGVYRIVAGLVILALVGLGVL